MSRKIIVSIVDGVASVEKPNDVEVEIREYTTDVERYDQCKQDKDGDWYQEMIFPATKIKFSANGDSCFTDVELKYHNYYECKNCDVKWEDEWDSTCDDECPKCETSHTPYKSDWIGEGEEPK